MPHIQPLAYVAPSRVVEAVQDAPWLIWIDGAQKGGQFANWSFLGISPSATVEAFPEGIRLNEHATQSSLWAILRERIGQQTKPSTDPGLPPFMGGWMGYFAYDFGQCLMDWPSQKSGERPLAQFGFYPVTLAWCHSDQSCYLISLDEVAAKRPVSETLLAAHAGAAGKAGLTPALPNLNWQCELEKDRFLEQIRTVQDYIAAGDIYQANLSQTLYADTPIGFSPFEHYLALRTANAAPFSAFVNFPGTTLSSTSPERFLKVTDRQVEARPIKGTIGGSPDPTKDADLRRHLCMSDKDRAENIMIVDLLRNDLSKVCRPHTVKTPDLCKLESYEGLHHLVSTVTGELKPGKDAVDVVAAAFPGGSITGAPKLRAVEIIDELETSPRGPYCGSIGYIDAYGTMDLSIMIRTVTYKESRAELKVGGGITRRSDPASEYDETFVKASRMLGKGR